MTKPQKAHPAHPHMQDFEAHIKAVEEDLEYYCTKRFEPRLFLLHRRGLITLYDILRANQRVAPLQAIRPVPSRIAWSGASGHSRTGSTSTCAASRSSRSTCAVTRW